MFKNVASQKVAVFAWDNAGGTAKTGDAANITGQISIDGGACAATDDTNPTELDATDAPGIYLFDTTQAETNGDLIVIQAASSTSDIEFRPVIIYTQTVMRGTDSAATASALTTHDGKLDTVDTVVDGIQTDLDNGTDGLGALKILIDGITSITVGEILAGTVEGAHDVQDVLKFLLSFIAGTVTGAGSTEITFRDTGDAKDRIVQTVDSRGNRYSVTLDGS